MLVLRYNGPGVATGEGVVNELDEIVLTATIKYDITDDTNSDFTIFGKNKNGDIQGREGTYSHSIRSDDIVGPGGKNAKTSNMFLKFFQFISNLLKHEQNMERASEIIDPTIVTNNTDGEVSKDKINIGITRPVNVEAPFGKNGLRIT